MTSVLVTGASGFVGAHVCQYLIDQGVHVRSLVRDVGRAALLRQMGCQLTLGDIVDASSMRSAVVGVDHVIHVAGLTKAYAGADFQKVNAVGTRIVVQSCLERLSPPVLTVISSLAVAGPGPSDAPHAETDEPRPVSCYGRSKLAGEQEALLYRKSIPLTIIRPPMVCGERDRDVAQLFSMVRTWGIMAIPGFKNHRYSIIHVRDLAEAIWVAALRGERADTDAPGRGVYYAACEERPTLIELGSLMAKAMNRPAPLAVHVPPRILKAASTISAGVAHMRGRAAAFNPDKVCEALAGSWICSNRKMREQLGVSPAPLLEKLKQTANWYFEQGWLRPA